jgi:hypothetical protein
LVIAIAGLACDLFAESLFIGWLPNQIGMVAPLASLLTGGAANGLYSAVGGAAHPGHPRVAWRAPSVGMGNLGKWLCPDDLYHVGLRYWHDDFNRGFDGIAVPMDCDIRMETDSGKRQASNALSLHT